MARVKAKARSTLDGLREDFTALGRVLDRSELGSLPRPVPLIARWLDTRTSVVMIGATGANKTFTLIGWACSVATGVPWLGNEVAIDPCPVIYVVGEGASGFDARIGAWEAANDTEVPRDRLVLVLQPESLTDEEFWAELRSLALAVGARLVVLDTFSSLAPDADETKDAAAAIRRMSGLAFEIDGAVVLAHHTGWGPQNRARGGSQLEANPDATVVLQKLDAEDPESVVSVWRKKDKDGPSGHTIHVVRRVEGGSCVLESVEAPAGTRRSTGSDAQLRLMREVLDVLRESADGLSMTELRKAVTGKNDAIKRAVDDLVELGQVSTRRTEFTDSKGHRRPLTVYEFEAEKIRLRAVPEDAAETPRSGGRRP